MKKQITKKMHYVAQFYLKQFTDSGGELKALNLEWLNINSFAPSGVLYEDYFYSLRKGRLDEFGQILEQIFQEFESNAKKKIDRFAENILTNMQISEKEKEGISEIAAVFFVRTKSFRQDHVAMNKSSLLYVKKILSESDSDKIYFGETDEVGIDLKGLEKKETEMSENNEVHIDFMLESMIKYTNLFLNKNWKVWVATGDELFVTSDNPVIDVSTGDQSYLGNNILFRKQYFVVSPRIVIQTEMKKVQNKRVKRKRIYRDEVNRINARIADNAQKQVFAKNVKFLEWLKVSLERYRNESRPID